jgi:N-acetyl-anhydromuramyl-L-alanine amidase AmpD|tara:strand:- start:34 stop:459 length:426 start_codon:yes stop_codon:yes gene_type:complete
MRKETKEIIIHCAATKPSMDVDAETIDRWHRERGWLKIGYHYVIKRDGTVETGRELEEVGAHAKGHNAISVGICLIGGLSEDNEPENNFTDEQWDALGTLVDSLKAKYPEASVIGHNDVSDKACPTFNVGEWYEGYKRDSN